MKKDVIIVEDNELNMEVMLGVLRAYDVDIRQSTDGISGLDEVRKQLPDVLLLDLQLPLMNHVFAHYDNFSHW